MGHISHIFYSYTFKHEKISLYLIFFSSYNLLSYSSYRFTFQSLCHKSFSFNFQLLNFLIKVAKPISFCKRIVKIAKNIFCFANDRATLLKLLIYLIQTAYLISIYCAQTEFCLKTLYLSTVWMEQIIHTICAIALFKLFLIRLLKSCSSVMVKRKV